MEMKNLKNLMEIKLVNIQLFKMNQYFLGIRLMNHKLFQRINLILM